ncbi:hypothetical protein D3C80_1184810 [compost metagenome]
MPSNSTGVRFTRPISSPTRFQSFETSMNKVRQGSVSRVRQPKISSPSSGVSSEV